MSPLIKRQLLFAVPAVTLLLWWVVGGQQADQPAPETAGESAETLPVAALSNSGAAVPSLPIATEVTGTVQELTEPSDHDIIARFEALNRYQRGTQSVSADDYDLLNPGARYERRQPLSRNPLDQSAQWSALFTADRFFITDDDSSTLTLQLWHGDDPAAVTVESAVAAMQDELGQVLTMPLGVIYAGDQALIRLRPSDYWPEQTGPLRVELTYSSFGLGQETRRLDFHYTGPERIPAEFIDVLADEAIAGDLVFDVAVDVRRAGQYRISALLYDASGRPIGRTQSNPWLEPEAQTVPLSFDGLLLSDNGAVGPFYLTTLRGERMNPLSATGSDQMPLLQGSYQTRQYQPDEFSNQIAASSHRERMKERYEAAIARGVKFIPPDS